MKHYFRAVTLTVSLMGSTLVPALKADDWDHRTNIKIDQSIDVQGTVLAPGSYVVKLLGSSVERRVVEIFNADESHIITTVLAMSAYRPSSGEGDFKFYKVAEGLPPALHTWFYPGENVGLEFRPSRRDAPAQAGQRRANTTTSNAGGD
jgi:hypothetical protein